MTEKILREALLAVQTWAEQRCPCKNEQPNPCPLCGADANKPSDVCLSAENTLPRHLRVAINQALAATRSSAIGEGSRVEGLPTSGDIISRKFQAFDLYCDEHPEFTGEWQDLSTETQDHYLSALRSPPEPRGWFVKDFADGWIYFDNEADAKRQVDATGAIMLAGYLPR
jgi:hypothetical protein